MMYCTGDSARWLPDGNLERTAREGEASIDGHRVSLAEIERCLESHPGIREAVVLFDDDDPLRQRLVAFLALRASLRVQPMCFVQEVKSHLAQWLPEWMVPGTYMQLPAIPRDADGRVQYEALPLPERPVAGDGATEQQSPAAEKIASIIQDLLGVPCMGMDTNLFDVGMSSLVAMHLTARIRDAYGVAPHVCQVLAAPTISGISHSLSEALRVRDSSFIPAGL
jgi:acyl carrier protein